MKRAKQNFKEFLKNPLSFLSRYLYEFCGKHQWISLITVILIFSVFLGLVIYKDFYSVTKITIASFDEMTANGSLYVDSKTSWATFFVDFATLPLLIITILFSAHGGFSNSQFQENEIKMLNEIQRKVSNFRVEQADNYEETIILRNNCDTEVVQDVEFDKPINSVDIDKLENMETNE